MKKIKSFFKKLILKNHFPYSLIRWILWGILLIVFQALFLTSSPYDDIRETWNVCRGGVLILCLVEFLRGVKWKNMRENMLKLIHSAGRFLFSVISGGMEILSRLFSLTRRDRDHMQRITNYKDITIKQGSRQKKKKRTRRWKSFGKMDNNEKVRFFYWKKRNFWEKRGVAVKDSSTPRELLYQAGKLKENEREREQTEKLVSEYQRVRYQSHYLAKEETVIELGESGRKN